KLEQADAAAFLIEVLHETDRLHEFEGIRLGEETVFDRSPHQSSIRSPARGRHSRRTSFRCLVRTTNWLKLFNEAYNGRKRSIRDAKRNTPPPANGSSSSSISTRIPRAKLMPWPEITLSTWR